MNIQQILTTVQQRKLQFFIVTLVVLSIVGLILRSLTLQKRAIRVKSPSFASQKPRLDVIIEGDTSFPSPEFPLYSITSHVSLENLFHSLADSLNLLEAPYSKNNYYDAQKNTSLSYEPTQGYIYYSNSADKADTAETLDQNQAVTLSQEFLQRMGFSPSDFRLDPDSVQFFQSVQSELEKTTSGPILNLHFQRTLHALPVTVGASTISYVDLFVSAKGVFKARFPALVFSFKEELSVPHLSIDQVKGRIQAGEYKILGTPLDVQTGNPVFSPFSSVILSVVGFEYRLDEEQRLFVPFIHFKGTGIPVNTRSSAPLELISPAIATQ